jgi:hypothetical protein
VTQIMQVLCLNDPKDVVLTQLFQGNCGPSNSMGYLAAKTFETF